MREAALHVPFEAIETMGFDVTPEDPAEVALREVRLVSCDDRGSVAAVTYSEPVDDVLTDADAVEWWKRLDRRGPGTTYLCEVVAPDLPQGVPGAPGDGLAVQEVTVEDGGCTLTVVGRQDVLRRSFECNAGDDVSVSLRRLADYDGPQDALDALTRRQREVLETAHDLGYYEVPREATADEVAGRLDLDRSTVTEHLQRAERNLLSAVLSG